MGAERDRVAEFGKLENGLRQAGDWYRWGPYVSERQWATVREDYSADGDAWNYLPHDQARSRGAAPAAGRGIPAGFWVFAAFAVLYGFCETMNGNWSQLDVTSLGVKPAIASLALTGFWATVTAGRVLLAAIQRWLPSRAAYHGLPFLLAVAFVLIAVLPSHAPAAAVAAFCLAGLGCSALLPLTISFGQRKLADHQAMVAGGVIACYQVGYGLAAFGVGPLTSAGVPAARDLRGQRGGGGRDGRAVAGGGAPPTVARRGAPPGRCRRL